MDRIMSIEEAATALYGEATKTNCSVLARQCREGVISNCEKDGAKWYINATREWPGLFGEVDPAAGPGEERGDGKRGIANRRDESHGGRWQSVTRSYPPRAFCPVAHGYPPESPLAPRYASSGFGTSVRPFRLERAHVGLLGRQSARVTAALDFPGPPGRYSDQLCTPGFGTPNGSHPAAVRAPHRNRVLKTLAIKTTS